MLEIKPEGTLTSYRFYHDVVPQLHTFFLEAKASPNIKSDQIFFDFSNLDYIDPMVLPNLLCAGYWIKDYFDRIAHIFVPSSARFTNMRTYLYRTDFIRLSQLYSLFEFNPDIKGGLNDTIYLPSVNQISGFRPVRTEIGTIDEEATKKRLQVSVSKTVAGFLNEFIISRTSFGYTGPNLSSLKRPIKRFCEELVENAILHGNSFCFLSLYATPKNVIKISVADCGSGFMNSINCDRDRALEIKSLEADLLNQIPNSKSYNNILETIKKIKKDCPCFHESDSDELYSDASNSDISRLSQYPEMETETQGIIYGVLTRIKSKNYGLYYILQELQNINNNSDVQFKGFIRIHSNNTQVVFSEIMRPLFRVYYDDITANRKNEIEIPAIAYKELTTNPKYKNNIRTDLRFLGTHIELEFRPVQESADERDTEI